MRRCKQLLDELKEKILEIGKMKQLIEWDQVCKEDLWSEIRRKKRQRTTQTQLDRRCGRRFKEAWCETMESESIG